jgi:hypothetical protein
VNVTEVVAPDYATKVLALAQFLLGRATDTSAQKKISVDAFNKMAGHLGIPLTKEQLLDMAQRPPLNQIISNIEQDTIVFKGADPDQMPMDQTQADKTVEKMADRAAKEVAKNLQP